MDELINMLKLYSRALQLAVDDDKAYALELLETASRQLGIPIPAIACDVE